MQKRTDYNGVTYFYSEALYPIRHGFSTRLGGLSRAEHTKSLNLGFYRGDKDIIVQKNIERFCEAVDVDPHTLIVMPQIHSSKVTTVNKMLGGHGIYTPASFEGDALVTDSIGTALGVRVGRLRAGPARRSRRKSHRRRPRRMARYRRQHRRENGRKHVFSRCMRRRYPRRDRSAHLHGTL